MTLRGELMIKSTANDPPPSVDDAPKFRILAGLSVKG